MGDLEVRINYHLPHLQDTYGVSVYQMRTKHSCERLLNHDEMGCKDTHYCLRDVLLMISVTIYIICHHFRTCLKSLCY